MNHIRNLLILVVLACYADAEPSQNLIRFASKPNDWFQSFEFRARPPAKFNDVNTVIVLLSKDVNTLDYYLLDPKWQRLAAQNNVGIVAAGFSFQNTLPESAKPGSTPLYLLNPKAASDLLHSELKRQIIELYPKVKYYGYFAKDDAVSMATSFILDSPKETRFWVIEDQFWSVPEKLRSLAGLVINRDKIKHGRMLEEHQINRNKRCHITFASDTSESREAIDEFTVNFISTMVSSAQLRPVIIDLDTHSQFNYQVPKGKMMRPSDKMAHTTWLPDAKLLQSWRALHSSADEFHLARITKEHVATGLAEQPELNFYLRMPSKLEDGESAKGVLCIASWYREENSMNDILRHGGLCKGLVDWADANKMAVITWNTAVLWKSGTGEAELEKITARHLNKNFDAIADAWEKGMRLLVAKYALPKEGYLFYGISCGAHWGLRLVLRRPQRFAAVHFHVANSFDIPDSSAKNVLWLITSGELDPGYQASFDFYRQCRNLDYPIIIKAGPNLGHTDREDIQKLSQAFFNYVMGLKASGGPPSNWTVVRDKTALADLMRQDLAKTTRFGDFINQGVYETDQGSWVPQNQRIQLTSSEIAEAWGNRADK